MSIFDIDKYDEVVTDEDLKDFGFIDSNPAKKIYRFNNHNLWVRCYVQDIKILDNGISIEVRKFYACFEDPLTHTHTRWVKDNPTKFDVIVLLGEIENFIKTYCDEHIN